jgi:hypothetical protein
VCCAIAVSPQTLKRNTPLTVLDLGFNRAFTDNNAKSLARLDLSCNRIDNQGKRDLARSRGPLAPWTAAFLARYAPVGP